MFSVLMTVEEDGRFEVMAILCDVKKKTHNPISAGIITTFINDTKAGRDFGKAFRSSWESLQGDVDNK